MSPGSAAARGRPHGAHLADPRDGDAAEGPQHVGLHPRGRLEHEDAARAEQVHGHLREAGRPSPALSPPPAPRGRCRARCATDLGVDLHGEEEPEAGVRLQGVQLLLQLHQPARGQVDVLQHHPPAGGTRPPPQRTRPGSLGSSPASQGKTSLPARLHGCVDGLVRLVKAFRRAWYQNAWGQHAGLGPQRPR